ncbi:MAG: hypothetical protein WC479_07210 [Candidatus Izemoplasmatales bacterium]
MKEWDKKESIPPKPNSYEPTQGDSTSPLKEKKDRVIEVLEMIATDMKNDAKRFDGQPFNGKIVAEYFGCQGAAIAALAKIIKTILENK